MLDECLKFCNKSGHHFLALPRCFDAILGKSESQFYEWKCRYNWGSINLWFKLSYSVVFALYLFHWNF